MQFFHLLLFVNHHKQHHRVWQDKGGGGERQYHRHKDKVEQDAAGNGIPAQGVRDIRELPDTHRHGVHQRGGSQHEHRQLIAPGRDNGRAEEVRHRDRGHRHVHNLRRRRPGLEQHRLRDTSHGCHEGCACTNDKLWWLEL